MHRNAYAVLIFLLPLALACPKRIEFGPEGELQDAQALLRLTDGVEAQVASVKGEAKLKVSSPQQNGSGGLFVSAARPGFVHFEALDFFGRPQSVLVCDGTRFAFLATQESKLYQGPASAENVSRFLPVALPPGELVELLLGQAPRLGAPPGPLALDQSAGAYVVTLQAGERTQTLWIHPRLHRVVESKTVGPGGYDVAFGDFEEATSSAFPKRITLRTASPAATIELQYKDVTLNEHGDPGLYALEPPPHTTVIEVDGHGRPVAP